MAHTPASSHGGSSVAPIGCVLGGTNLDVHAAGAHFVAWTAKYDNPRDLNVIAALPAGIGFTLSVDNESLIFAAAGTWAYEFTCAPAADATFAGSAFLTADLGALLIRSVDAAAAASSWSFQGVVQIPAGAEPSLRIQTISAALANPYTLTQLYMSIIKLS